MITSDPALRDAAGTASVESSEAGACVAEFHENAVPPYAEAILEQLYGNVFSTLAHQRVYGAARNLNTFVLRAGGAVRMLWLYERRGRSVHVINEGIEIDDAEVGHFARALFARHPALGAITFHAVQSRLQRLPFPHTQNNCLEDMVLKLPASSVDYLAQMGKSTRSYINRYLNKLRRDHPSTRFDMVEAHELDEGHLRRIIDLNRARMAGKGKISINDDAVVERIAHLAMSCGVIGVLTIDGRIVAGTINYRVRDNYFLEVIAHDPAYNDYRLGTLCCYLTVCECIARGGSEYHFLWGQDEYKSRLLGKRRDLDDVVVYRSRVHRWLHADLAFGTWVAHCERRMRLRMRALRQGNGRTARVVDALLRAGRSLRGE